MRHRDRRRRFQSAFAAADQLTGRNIAKTLMTASFAGLTPAEPLCPMGLMTHLRGQDGLPHGFDDTAKTGGVSWAGGGDGRGHERGRRRRRRCS